MIAALWTIPQREAWGKSLSQPYRLHYEVYRLFPDVRQGNYQQHSGILYADQGGNARCRQILLLADRRPQAAFGSLAVKEVRPAFLRYQYYRFRVVLNPCRRDNRSGKIKAVRGEDEAEQWIRQRARQSWGFEVGELQWSPFTDLRIDRPKGNPPITLNHVVAQGTLHVSDGQKFQHSFHSGVGRARAFGFGLLQLQPIG